MVSDFVIPVKPDDVPAPTDAPTTHGSLVSTFLELCKMRDDY